LISGPAPSGWLLQEDVYKFSCTQIQAPADIAGFLMQWGKQNIPEENLYYDEKGDNGREVEPHVTVKYGLQIPAPNQALLQIIGTTKPFKVKLGLVSLFENPKFDVVKVDVDSPELHQLNRAISEAIPCKDTFPDYHPHMTIAYVKKGTGRALNGKNVFVDAPDVGSAFWAGNILFTGSGDSDDPDRVKQIIDFDHSKGPGDDLDEAVDELKDFASGTPRWAVVLHKRSGEPLYVANGRKLKWVRSPALARSFGTRSEAEKFLSIVGSVMRYNRHQLFVRPLIEAFNPKDYASGLPEQRYAVTFTSSRGRKTYLRDQGDAWHSKPSMADATPYTWEDGQRVLHELMGQKASQQTDYSLSLLPFNESEFDPKDYATDVPLPLYKVVFLKGPSYWNAARARWSPDIEEATGYSLEEAEDIVQKLVEANPDDAHLFKAVNYYEVTRAARRDTSESEDPIKDFALGTPKPQYVVHNAATGKYFYERSPGLHTKWVDTREEAARFDQHGAAWRAKLMDGKIANGVQTRMEVQRLPPHMCEAQRVCVKVHSVNDRCSYYFDGHGKASKQPVPLDPHNVSRAKRAAEKIYGKGSVRVEPVNESGGDEDLKSFALSLPKWVVVRYDQSRTPWYLVRKRNEMGWNRIKWVKADEKQATIFPSKSDADKILQVARALSFKSNSGDSTFVQVAGADLSDERPDDEPMNENFDPKEYALNAKPPGFMIIATKPDGQVYYGRHKSFDSMVRLTTYRAEARAYASRTEALRELRKLKFDENSLVQRGSKADEGYRFEIVPAFNAVGESNSDPFEGLGFKAEVSAFARRGRMLRKQRTTF
jgi:hypothetical protein